MLPLINYQQYFKNNVLIISGVGRSGTTILGKLIGSMENTIYLFEPAIMKYFPMLWHKEINEDNSPKSYPGGFLEQMFLGTLFEDYILPIVQGRSLNTNPSDWTYYQNHITEKELKNRWKLSRREQAVEWFEKNNPKIVIKTNEAQHLFFIFENLFYGCKFIHIIRNGLDTIADSLDRGWFKSDYPAIEFATGSVPLYVDKQARRYWQDQNPVTKAACTWRCLVDIEDKENIWQFKYEDFCQNPKGYIEKAALKYFMKETEITERHIESVKKFKSSDLSKVNEEDIQEPERQKFKDMMIKIGYN